MTKVKFTKLGQSDFPRITFLLLFKHHYSIICLNFALKFERGKCAVCSHFANTVYLEHVSMGSFFKEPLKSTELSKRLKFDDFPSLVSLLFWKLVTSDLIYIHKSCAISASSSQRKWFKTSESLRM